MHDILVYGDSITWGIIPETRNRFPFDERWPGVLENQIRDSGKNVRVIEDSLNGRRTVWEDPFRPGRNGRQGLAQRIEIHSPLSLVIVMLGTNDFQFSHPYNNAWSAAQGIVTLVNDIRNAPSRAGDAGATRPGCLPTADRSAEGFHRREIPGRRREMSRSGGCLSRGHFRPGLSFLRRRERDCVEPRRRHPSGC